MSDLLDELRDANPVDENAVEVPAGLSARVLSPAAASTHPARTRRLRLPLAVVATAAAVSVVILLLPGGRGGTPDLAARAYAATSAGGSIIHWRTEQHSYSNGRHTDHQRNEGWARNGVTHDIRYVVRRGVARLTSETRTAEGRTRTYLASDDDYISGPVAKGSQSNPLASGDPFAIFRRAYRTGRLEKVGPQRYAVDLPGRQDDLAIYDLDPDTGLPERFELTTSTVGAGKRYDNRLVLRFDTYERLPFTPANRAKLRLLPHHGAGPKDDPPANHFAVLRSDRRPGAEAMRAIETFAGHNRRMGLDAHGARALGPRQFLIPGHGYLCLVTIGTGRLAGFGGGCITVAQAVERGMGSGTPEAGKTVVVPDGVTALRVRIRGGRRATVAVRDNHATLPFSAFAWRFVR